MCDVRAHQLRLDGGLDALAHLFGDVLASLDSLADLGRVKFMSRDVGIPISLRTVAQGEDKVEPREQRRFEVDLFRDGFVFVEATVLWVRGGQQRRACGQACVDTRLRHRHLLLFQCRVECRAVVGVHVVEFVDAREPVVGLHDGPAFDGPLVATEVVADGARSKSGR